MLLFSRQIMMIAFHPRHLDISGGGALKWVPIVSQDCTMGSCFKMQRSLLCRQLGSLAGKYEHHTAFTRQVMMIAFHPRQLDNIGEGIFKWAPIVFQECLLG